MWAHPLRYEVDWGKPWCKVREGEKGGEVKLGRRLVGFSANRNKSVSHKITMRKLLATLLHISRQSYTLLVRKRSSCSIRQVNPEKRFSKVIIRCSQDRQVPFLFTIIATFFRITDTRYISGLQSPLSLRPSYTYLSAEAKVHLGSTNFRRAISSSHLYSNLIPFPIRPLNQSSHQLERSVPIRTLFPSTSSISSHASSQPFSR